MCLFLLLFAPRADAFSPAVHRALALRAMGLDAAAGNPAHADAFARGAVGEDWNLPRKWTRWHHYYSPAYFPVRSLWRHPSAERVSGLDGALRAAFTKGEADRAWLLAGQLVHHVQDMASPPHVVPVAHGLADGFERSATPASVALLLGMDVPEVAGVDAQLRLAEATSAALLVPLVCDGETMEWSAFWAPRDGAFGAYGTAGNRFGRVLGCEAGMAAFTAARLEDALAYTRAVVRYAAAVEAGSGG